MAVQTVPDGHDTPWSHPVEGVGMGWIDQPIPSQRSANGAPAESPPTAVQAVLDVHDTSENAAPGEAGKLRIDQRLPSQRSANAGPTASVSTFSYQPTAVQAVLDVHETPTR